MILGQLIVKKTSSSTTDAAILVLFECWDCGALVGNIPLLMRYVQYVSIIWMLNNIVLIPVTFTEDPSSVMLV